MVPIYNDKESFESALEKAWKYYNESASRTVDSFEDDYIECVFSKGFREGFLYKEKQKELTKENVIKEFEKEFYACSTTPKWFHKTVQDAIYIGKAEAFREIQKEYDRIREKEIEDIDYGIAIEEWEKQKEQKPKNIVTNNDSLRTAYLKGQTDVIEDPKSYGLQKEQKLIKCIEFNNEFENQVSHLIASVLNGEHEYNEGFIKYVAQSLFEFVKKEQKTIAHENDLVSKPKTSLEILKHYLIWAENSEEDCPYTWKELAAAINDGITALEQNPVINNGQQECPYKDLALVKDFFGKYKRKCKLSNKACDSKECEQWNELQVEFKNKQR